MCIRVHMHAYVCVCMYACIGACVYVCIRVYVCLRICMSAYMYAYTFTYARVWVYICTRVGTFCLFVLSNLSVTCACMAGVSEHLHAYMGGDFKWGFFQLVCGQHSLLAWEAMFWQG